MSHGLLRSANLELCKINETRSSAAHNSKIPHGNNGGTKRGMASGDENARVVVVRLTVAFAALVPSSVTEEGETVHVAAGGAPEQLQDTI